MRTPSLTYRATTRSLRYIIRSVCMTLSTWIQRQITSWLSPICKWSKYIKSSFFETIRVDDFIVFFLHYQYKHCQLVRFHNVVDTRKCDYPVYWYMCRTGMTVDFCIHRCQYNYRRFHLKCIHRDTRNGTCRIYSRIDQTRTSWWTCGIR